MAPTLAAAPYRMRSITPRDQAGLTRFYAGLSTNSRVARFHGTAPIIPDATARFFCGPDHEHREGIVAECFDAVGDAMIVGHVCIEPVNHQVAEIAIAVSDAWQRRGVGRAMLIEAITWAESHGITRLTASMRCSNTGMFALLRSMDHPITYGAPIESTVDAHLDVGNARPLAA